MFRRCPVIFHLLLSLALTGILFAGAAPAQTDRGVRVSGPGIRQWAILVGVSDYANDAARLGAQGVPDLSGASNDAQAYYDFLVGQQKVPPDQVVLLKDSQATSKNIRRAFLSLGKRVGPKDQILVFFAGHGIAGEEAGGRSYLLAHDSDLRDLEGSAILFDEFAMWVQDSIPADKKVLVVDACHSGNFLKSFRGPGANAINDSMMERLRATKGTAFITASSGSQVSVEDQGRGLFTKTFLEGLSGAGDLDHDGVVTVSEAYQFVYRGLTEDPKVRQTPTQGGSYDFGMPLAWAAGVSFPARPKPAPLVQEALPAPPKPAPKTAPPPAAPGPADGNRIRVLADGSWALPEVSPPSGGPAGKTVTVSARATGRTLREASDRAASLAAQEFFQGIPPTVEAYKNSVYRLYSTTVHRTPDGDVRAEVAIEFYKEGLHGKNP